MLIILLVATNVLKSSRIPGIFSHFPGVLNFDEFQ